MDLQNNKHVGIYIIGAGFLMYILAATLNAIFVITLPIDDTWYQENVVMSEEIDSIDRFGNESYSTQSYITNYENAIEISKYYHNQRMNDIHRYITSGLIAFGIITTLFLFYFIPRLNGKKLDGDEIFSAFLIGLITSSIMPLLYGWLLPAPVEWFPSIIREIHKSQVQNVMNQLRN